MLLEAEYLRSIVLIGIEQLQTIGWDLKSPVDPWVFFVTVIDGGSERIHCE